MTRKTGDMKQPSKKELRERIAALTAENAAAYERGAMEFAEWLWGRPDEDLLIERLDDIGPAFARFLASRGTAEG